MFSTFEKLLALPRKYQISKRTHFTKSNIVCAFISFGVRSSRKYWRSTARRLCSRKNTVPIFPWWQDTLLLKGILNVIKLWCPKQTKLHDKNRSIKAIVTRTERSKLCSVRSSNQNSWLRLLLLILLLCFWNVYLIKKFCTYIFFYFFFELNTLWVLWHWFCDLVELVS